MNIFEVIKTYYEVGIFKKFLPGLGLLYVFEDFNNYFVDPNDINVYRTPDGTFYKYIEYANGCKIGFEVNFDED